MIETISSFKTFVKTMTFLNAASCVCIDYNNIRIDPIPPLLIINKCVSYLPSSQVRQVLHQMRN